MNIHKIKSAYFIGIGGIGMSGLAQIMHAQGVSISGSDLNENDSTKKLIDLGITVNIGKQDKKNLPKVDLVVFSSAVEVTNPERQAAQDKKIPQLDYHQALGELTESAENIVITGTHGKTTTTAITGLILGQTNLNPTVLVGSNIKEFGSNVKIGNAEEYVLEGDEYQKGILALHPSTVILTNVEWDHADIYPTEADYIQTIQDFVNKIPPDGHLIYNRDDHNTLEHIVKPDCNISTFAIDNEQADLVAKNLKSAHGRQIFKLVWKGVELKDFNIKLPGRYNIYNALAAACAALAMSIPQDTIKDTLATFTGAWRRFEKIGTLNGAPVISDYAHHPTELESVIKAAKGFFEEKKIIVYFQPHQKARTRLLLNDFVHALTQCDADMIFVNEIYDVPGRSEDEEISSKDIVEKVQGKKIEYVENLEKGVALMKKKVKEGYALIVIGAGDIDKAMREIVEKA